MINYLVISKKKWDANNFKTLNKSFKFLNKLDNKKIINFSPKIIFFIHWSKKKYPQRFSKVFCVFNFTHQIYLNLKEDHQYKIKLLEVLKKLKLLPLKFQIKSTLEIFA